MNPKFPLVHLLNDNLIYGVRLEKEFRKASLSLLSVFDDSMVVDSEGILFKITKAYKIGWNTFFFGYHPFVKGRLIKIDYEIQSSEKITLEEFKGILLERIRKKYSNRVYSFLSKGLMIEKINNASSFNEIIELFIYDVS